MNNDSNPQRTRSDKKKTPALQRTALLSILEREATPSATASLLQRSSSALPAFANTSPNNPYFPLGVQLHTPKSNIQTEPTVDDIEDFEQPAKLSGNYARRSTAFTNPPTFPVQLHSAKEIIQILSQSTLPAVSHISQQKIEKAAAQSASPSLRLPIQVQPVQAAPTGIHLLTPRQRELALAALAGPKERKQLAHSRVLGSQDSERSQDGPITQFLRHTKDGYLPGNFIVEESENGSNFNSQSHTSDPSGGSASQDYYPSQNSDAQNVADPTRHYNFRSQRASRNSESEIRKQFIRKNGHDQCHRCGAIHFYIDEFCTAKHDIDGNLTAQLPHDTIEHRLRARELFSLNEPDVMPVSQPATPVVTAPLQIQAEDMALFAEFIKFKQATQNAGLPAIFIDSGRREMPGPDPGPSNRIKHQVPPAPLDAPLSDDDNEEQQSQTSSRSRRSSRSSQDIASVIASAISQTLAHTPSASEIAIAMATAMGKSSHNMTTNDPPKITKILDSIHLMTVIWPAYQAYEHQAGRTPYRSLWDLYNHDQKVDILEFFQEPVIIVDDDNTTVLHRNEEWFDSLSSLEFLTAMCRELGYPSVIIAESALKAITFPGPLSDLQSWVTFKAAWTLALKQMSARSRISDKNLSTIFKNSLPSAYWKSNYDQQGHRDWLSGYKWCVKQLSNKEFQSGYNIDAEQMLKSADAKHSAEIEKLKLKIATLESAVPSHQKKEVKSDKVEGKAKSAEQVDKPKSDKPWEVQGNVNPKWDPQNQRDDNPHKIPCVTCTALHKYSHELCTAAKVKGTQKDTPRLDPKVLQQRKWDKQELGHYCTKLVPNPALPATKTIEIHHANAADTAATLGGSAKKK